MINKMKTLTITAITVFSLAAGFATKAQTIETGRRALELKNYNQAKATFQKLISGNPMDGQAYYWLGESYYATEAFDSARMAYNNGVTSAPKEALNLVGLGSLELDKGDGAKAKTYFDQATKLAGKKSGQTLARIGVSYTRSDKTKDLVAAEASLKAAVEKEPKNTDFIVLLGDVYKERAAKGGNVGDAIVQYEYAIAANPKDPKPYLRKAQANKTSRIYNEVEPLLLKAKEVDSNYAPVWEALGDWYAGSKRLPQALYAYKKFISLTEQNRTVLTQYAGYQFLAKDFRGVLKTVDQLLRADSSNNATNNSLYKTAGYAYAELGQSDKALLYLRRFLERNQGKRPVGAFDYAYLAKGYYLQGNMDSAYANQMRASSLDSNQADGFTPWADSANARKDNPALLKAWETRAMYKPYSFTAKESGTLGLTYYNTSQYAKADSVFGLYTARYPQQAIGFYYRALVNQAIDKTGATSAKYYEDFIMVAKAGDVTKQKSNLQKAYSFLYDYYTKRNNKAKAAEYQAELKALGV
jgi:Flp pilus assembly protein TadD